MILKLKRTPGIYLVGFMGSGKTTIGRRLAERLGWHFIDLDQEIETRQKSKISEIFAEHGEDEFRRLESEALRARVRAIECGRPTVVALGGGAFVPGNFEVLENNGVTIWLDCPLELARQRVERETHRPLAFDAEKFERLYEARREGYSRADYHITIVSDDPDIAVNAVLDLPFLK
jgi:shikimate kinase